MKERIKNLLASGMKAVDVASTVGCSPGYVSQLLKDEVFKKEVEAEMIASQTSNTEDEHLDKRYVKLEHLILNNIETSIVGAELPQLTRALEVVAKRQTEKARSKLPVPASQGNGVNVYIANIALPAHAVPKAPVVQMNEKNEIIAIDARPLAPMSANGVKNIFAQMQQNKAEEAKVLTEI